MSSVTDEKAGDGDAIVVINTESTSTSIDLLKSTTPQVVNVSESPRIICNELLVKPVAGPPVDHMDELSSLEREIAKMHYVEDTAENMEVSMITVSNSSCVGKNDNGKDSVDTESSTLLKDNCNIVNPSSSTKHNITVDPISSGETALEHDDLIAVLKGLDDTHNTCGDASLIEGVTIEGEGEYQIMEVIDEDSTAADDIATTYVAAETSNAPTTNSTTHLTAEEERALALEQMECLKTKTRRRKQDIKPIKQAEAVIDLVSALEAEWTDTDEEHNREMTHVTYNTNHAVKKESASSEIQDDTNPDTPLVTSVVVIQSPKQSSHSTTATTDIKTEPNTTPVGEAREIEGSKSSPLDGIIEEKREEDSQIISTTTGFRRTRIIKRKIIWDPDAPETTFSYAKLVTNNNKPKVKQEPSSATTSTITKGSTTIRPIKKEPSISSLKKTSRPATPKEKLVTETNSQQEKKSIIVKKITSDEPDTKTFKSEDKSPSPVREISPNIKKRSQTPLANGPGGTKKKKITELDRLMGDEGAVNMLNSLEKMESTVVGSDTKATRPMMRSRAATICEKLQTHRKDSTSPAKVSPPASTQQSNNKGKRSTKSRASSSWDYVYKQKQQNLDDSMIIRRRSNSSYSSTASLNRLSLDGPPTSSTNGPNNSTSKSNESTAFSTTKTSSSKITSKTLEESSPTSSLHTKSAGAGSNNNSPPLTGGKSFEFAKPENKKAQRRTKSPGGTLANDLKKPTGVANKRNVRSPANMNEDKSESVSSNKSPPFGNNTTKDKTHTSDVVVKKSAKVTQIIFSTNKAKISYTFTTQMLNKLVDILDKLASDPDTHVTVITTNDANFCQGIDLAELIASGSTEKRKNAGKNLSTAVKKYLKTLATFPKPLIVGVNGHVMNLGVMQLAFFDIVVAGDKCTYETPYVKLGQVPEGYCLWNNLNKIRGSFKTKLFWLNEKIQSTEAVLAGLVNKLSTGNKVNEEAVLIAKKVASMPPESYRVMKKIASHHYIEVIDSLFDEEFNTIAEQWSSSEFLENVKKYHELGHF